jgi:hypothetical protein
VGGFKVRTFRQVLQDRFLSIMRSDLARLIYQSLEGRVRTLFGDTVTQIEQDDEAVDVTFAHAPPRGSIWCWVPEGCTRRSVPWRLDPRSGTRITSVITPLRSVSKRYPHSDPSACVSFAAPGRQISRYSLRGYRTVFFIVFASDKKLSVGHHDVNAQMSLLRTLFGNGQWECPEILKAFDTCTDFYFDPVRQIRMQAWSEGRVTLVGDACLCPSLLAGQRSAPGHAGRVRFGRGAQEGCWRPSGGIPQPRATLARFHRQEAARRRALLALLCPNTKFGIFARKSGDRSYVTTRCRKASPGPLAHGLARLDSP